MTVAVNKNRRRGMVLREYKPLDCEALAELFYNTVHRVNIKDYTKEQLSLIHISEPTRRS